MTEIGDRNYWRNVSNSPCFLDIAPRLSYFITPHSGGLVGMIGQGTPAILRFFQ